MIHKNKSIRAALALGLAGSTLSAQDYSIDWHKISSGGGMGSSGQFGISGTIGQPDAGGALSGGRYSLTGGFWSLISLVQSAGAPPLSINRTGGSVRLSWPSVSGWNLQESASLMAPNWVVRPYPVTTADGTNTVTLTPPTGSLFFRLSLP